MNASTLTLALGLSACATHVPPDGAPMPDGPAAEVDDGHVSRGEHEAHAADVQASLDRLVALELIDVGQLVVNAPAAGGNCYGPCADDPVDQAWMQEHARQAGRLAALVARAEDVADAPAEPLDNADAAVDSLRSLAIVEIGAVHYEAGGNCYIGFCPGDAERRGRVAALAEAARDL